MCVYTRLTRMYICASWLRSMSQPPGHLGTSNIQMFENYKFLNITQARGTTLNSSAEYVNQESD